MQKRRNASSPEEMSTNDFLIMRDFAEKRIKSFTQIINVSLYHFYITGEIEFDVDPYIEMINILKTAEEHDQIFIYLNTPGGSISTAIQIISAIKQSVATVTTVIEGDVCSAGTLIFFAGDHFVVNDHCTLMIHNYSHGPYGKGNELKSQVNYSDRYFTKLANDFYKNFLTEDEIKAVCEDKDFWMDSDEIIERFKRNGIPVKRSLREVEAEIFSGPESSESESEAESTQILMEEVQEITEPPRSSGRKKKSPNQ